MQIKMTEKNNWQNYTCAMYIRHEFGTHYGVPNFSSKKGIFQDRLADLPPKIQAPRIVIIILTV